MSMWDRAVLDILREIVGLDAYAVLAYGSRVAGYAGPDSDYDYIYIVEDFKPKIKYIYREVDGTYISILVVDKSFLEEDVYLGAHGEFVAGRLYSVYNALTNGEYIRRLEILLKKRAILEELRLLKLKYGRLLKYMRIPMKYFLLARLKKRIVAYPPVKYSYYKTFYGEKGVENFRRSLDGFESAAHELHLDGIFEYSDGYVYNIVLDRIPSSLTEIFKYILRGVAMYFTHGRSASVTLDVVLDEVRGKVRRGVRSIRIPRELDNPEILLQMSGIYFSAESIDLEELVKTLFGYKAEIKSFYRAGLLSNLYIMDVEVEGECKKLVIKSFPLLSIVIKWIWLVIWLYGLKRFTFNPWERMYREVDGLITLGRNGFNVPKVYAVVWGDRMVIEEYIDGIRLDKVREGAENFYRQAGEMIGEVHSRLGLTIGDTKPQNFIVKEGKIYLVDLEQFNTDDCYEWDIVELTLYTLIFFRRFGERLEIISSILDGYIRGNPRFKNILENLLRFRMVLAFLPLVPPNIYGDLKKIVDRYLHDGE